MIFKPAAWRGNWIGLIGIVLVYASIWLDADKKAGPRMLLIIGTCICGLGLINHLFYLFTQEAKETIWEKGGLLTLAITPAPWRGMRIGLLGMIIGFLSMGLFWLNTPYALLIFPVGFIIVGLGFVNHLMWFWQKAKNGN